MVQCPSLTQNGIHYHDGCGDECKSIDNATSYEHGSNDTEGLKRNYQTVRFTTKNMAKSQEIKSDKIIYRISDDSQCYHLWKLKKNCIEVCESGPDSPIIHVFMLLSLVYYFT